LSEDKNTTQDRLLDAAEALFSEKAFENVSIRELAAAADVNVAAVNYHFQNKENLFHEVVQRRFVAQRDITLAALDELLAGTGGRPQVDQVIRILVRTHLTGALPGPGKASFLALMARQMDPGNVHMAGPFFKTIVAPVFAAFAKAIIAARPGLPPEQVPWIAASIVGQIHHLIIRWHKRQALAEDPECLGIMLKAFPALNLDLPEYMEMVTDHITRFSTAAIDGLYPEVTS
jgi:AcrR family transcriptional regulator